MCLETVTQVMDPFEPNSSVIGYKVRHEDGRCLFPFSNYDPRIAKEGEVHARVIHPKIKTCMGNYPVGFHSFTTLEGAEYYNALYNLIVYRIWQVRCIGILALGRQLNCDVIVSDKIEWLRKLDSLIRE